MPTPAEIDDLEQEVSNLGVLATAALVDQFGAALSPDPVESAQAVTALVDTLVIDYATAGVAAAVDFYSSVRPGGSPAFTPPAALPDDLIGGGTFGWLSQPLVLDLDALSADIQAGVDLSLRRSAEAMQKALRDAVNDAIGIATEADPLDGVRYARFPQSANPCAFCVLRAARGAVFYGEETATRGDHTDCRCKVTMIFPGEELPYRRAPYFEQYQNALDAEYDAAVTAIAAGPLRGRARSKAMTKALLAAMRRTNGIR